MGGGVVGGQRAVEDDGFLGGGQRVLVAAHPVQPVAEVVQRQGEVSLVGGGVVGGQRAAQGDDEVCDCGVGQEQDRPWNQVLKFGELVNRPSITGSDELGNDRVEEAPCPAGGCGLCCRENPAADITGREFLEKITGCFYSIRGASQEAEGLGGLGIGEPGAQAPGKLRMSGQLRDNKPFTDHVRSDTERIAWISRIKCRCPGRDSRQPLGRSIVQFGDPPQDFCSLRRSGAAEQRESGDALFLHRLRREATAAPLP